MNEKLYKLYREDFTSYVNGLEIHNVKLNDLRLKQICKKWDINIRDGNNGSYWLDAELDEELSNTINKLLSLKK